MRQVDLRPARAVVGLSHRLLPDGWPMDPWEKLPDDRVEHAPARREFYWGRIEDVDDDRIVATLWAWPSGRQVLVDLPRDEHVSGQPRCGDLLAVWTWQELPGGGQVRDRRYSQVVHRRLSDDQRAALQALVGDTV